MKKQIKKQTLRQLAFDPDCDISDDVSMAPQATNINENRND